MTDIITFINFKKNLFSTKNIKVNLWLLNKLKQKESKFLNIINFKN